MRKTLPCLAILASLALTPVASAAPGSNLISNGGFEAGADPGSFTTYVKGSPLIPGWRVTLGTVDVLGPGWKPASGKRSLDLDGTPGPGAIAQSVVAVPGTTYTVTFALAANPECAPTVKRLMVSAGGVTRHYSFDSSHTTNAAMGWRTNTFSFVAHSARTTLTFTSTDPAGSNCGPALDDISVVAGTGVSTGHGSAGGASAGGKPCYVNTGAFASVGPCFGPAGTPLSVKLLRPMKSPPAMLRFDRMLVNSVPGVVLAPRNGKMLGSGSVYVVPAPAQLCMGPGFPKKWSVTLIDAKGIRQGQIGDFTITGCP